MAEKNTGRGRKSTSSRSTGNSSNNSENGLGLNLTGAKMERLYDVLEALIDTLDMPTNKGRAIKYGIRAIGEFMTPDEDTSGRRGGSGNSRASLADDEQNEGSSTSRRG
jgi:hypothetical protein